MVTKKIVVLMFLFLILSCKDQQLILKREDYHARVLPIRMDGFYVLTSSADFSDGRGYQRAYVLHFLYQNGIIFGGATYPADSVDNYTTAMIEKFYRLENKYKSQWGIFNIQNGEIQFEKWVPSTGGPMKTVIRQGDVLNDTAFVIRKVLDNYEGKTYLEQDTFRFRQFSPKPDSTNRFIK